MPTTASVKDEALAAVPLMLRLGASSDSKLDRDPAGTLQKQRAAQA